MKVTAKDRKATKEVFDLLEDEGLYEEEAVNKIALKYKVSASRLTKVITYIDESRMFVDNGKTMVRR